MNSKMIVGTGLIVGIVVIALLALPIQAYVNGTGDMLRIQEQDRLRTSDRDCDCNGDMLQTQERDRLRAQDCDYTCDGKQTQYRYGQRTQGTSDSKMNSEQYRYQYRNQNREETGKP